jgi:hypothetical protein
MNPEMPDDVEFGYSSSRMLPLVALAAMMTLLSASSAFDWFGDKSISRYHALGYVGLGFFGIAICRLIWLLFVAQEPVLLIGRYGIRDLRVADDFILWDSVADVSTCEYRRRKYVALKITAALERQLITTKSRQAMLNANRAMGVDGIAISADGLTADFDTLIGACTTHHAAANQAGATREQKGGTLPQSIARCA